MQLGTELEGKRVLVMGLGLHGGGLGVTKWLLRQGAQVTVTDLKKREELAPTLEALRGEPVEYVLGEHRESDFTRADLIVRNPGVPAESRYLSIARERGIPIRMELGLFIERLPLGTRQVIGITGTKGKTTTTLMTGAILTRANPKTVVAGNLRISALELLERIDAETPVVLEMSSFQLEEFAELRKSPHIAALTNIYPDHLNRYASMDEYVRAKAQILLHQRPDDICVLNFDNSILTRLRPRVAAHVVWFSRTKRLTTGVSVEDGWIVAKDERGRRPLVRTSDLIAGAHNLENALAAAAVAGVWGASEEQIGGALEEFKGVPHRLELVRELEGVRYVNDTTATAPAATIAALETEGRHGGQIHLIAGGYDKGLDYETLARAIVKHRTSVILLKGTATGKLERALVDAGGRAQIIASVNSLEEAVSRARAIASPGDTILLSPGAASFGMFANEFERGEVFREIVAGL